MMFEALSHAVGFSQTLMSEANYRSTHEQGHMAIGGIKVEIMVNFGLLSIGDARLSPILANNGEFP